MKITLIGLKDNSQNIFPSLCEALVKKISNVELAQRYAPVPEDLPLVALEAAEESDFLIVFAPIEDDKIASFVKRKLVDVELASKTRILKLVSDEYSASGDLYEFENEKHALVEKIVEMAVNILFNENAFEPKDKEFY